MNLCVTTVVDNAYMAWLPAFVYCMNRAYPHYRVRLFLRDQCPYDLKAWKLDCDIIPMFEDFPRYTYLSIALRFAIDREYFKEFDHVYVTDIDMMIMNEDKDIEYFHCMEMQQTGLCYSNSLRNYEHYEGKRSLTGLHFASREWFERTNDLTAEYRELMRHGLVGLYREYDGCMLYRLADRSGCGIPGKYKLAKRHHGIHMNNFQLFGDNRLKLDVRIPMEYRVQWMRHMGNRIFQDIIATCRKDSDLVESNVKCLDDFINGRI